MSLLKHEITLSVVIIVIFGATVVVAKGMIELVKPLPTSTIGWSMLALAVVVALSSTVATWLIRRNHNAELSKIATELTQLKTDFDRSFQSAIEAVEAQGVHLQRQIKATADLAASWENLSRWTVAEAEVLEVERDWHGQVYVLVPDLYYELEEKGELRGIIAENICKPGFKGYVYFLPETGWQQFVELRKVVKRSLASRSQPTTYADNKLQCCVLPSVEFPFAATAGAVLYTDADDRDDLAYSHLPIEFPTTHLNIQLNRDNDHKFYSSLKLSLRAYLDNLKSKYPTR